MQRHVEYPAPPDKSVPVTLRTKTDKSFLLLFFKKEALSYFAKTKESASFL
jgi:hypothetical protein